VSEEADVMDNFVDKIHGVQALDNIALKSKRMDWAPPIQIDSGTKRI
jgi:hypothetical protein